MWLVREILKLILFFLKDNGRRADVEKISGMPGIQSFNL